MLLLSVQRFTKFYSKIENLRHHPRPEALLASLEAFRSDVSSCVTQLLFNLKPEFEIAWIHQCFLLLPAANKAFAKLVMEIDYGMPDWQAKSMEDYLNYSLELLDFFNSITASVSHLSHVRLSLLHALSLRRTSLSSSVEKMKAIAFHSPVKEIELSKKSEKRKKEICWSDKESVVVQALIELRSIGLWTCRVVLAILSGDEKIYAQMRELSNPALNKLDSNVGEIMKKGCLIKEVKELKDSLAFVSGEGNGDQDMRAKLEEFEKQLNEIRKEVDRVFSEVLAGRNELLNGLRFRK